MLKTEKAGAFDLCEGEYIRTVFFNGMRSNESDSKKSLEYLKYRMNEYIGKTYNNKKISYDLIYNSHVGIISDLTEVFNQRRVALDDGDYLFAKAITSENNEILKKIKSLDEDLSGIVDDMVKDVEEIAKKNDLKETEIDYSAHNLKLDKISSKGEKILFVGHSQGNMFMNHAYNHVTKKLNRSKVAVMHVAPASKELHGKYVLSSNDGVINVLKFIFGDNAVLESNITIPFSPEDMSGHKIIETYLNNKLNGVSRIMVGISELLFDMEYVNYNKRGFFNAAITVKGGFDRVSEDIIIVVKEPDGANPNNYARYFDDMTAFESSCESAEVSGEYEIGYNDGGSLAGREATLTIADNNGVEIAKRDFVIGEGLSQWWLLPKVDIGKVLVRKKNDSDEYEILFY